MILVWLLAFGAHATTLTSDTSVGSDYWSQQISSDGNFTPDFSGVASYSYARLNESGTTGNFVDETNTLAGALSWLPAPLQFRLGASASNTAAEQLTTRGLTLDGGYRGHEWKWKIGVGGTSYTEGYSGTTRTKKGKARTTTGTESIQQRFVRGDVRWVPLAWLHLRTMFTAFGYGRDVAKFEANLDSPAAVRRGADGFGGVVGGLPANSLLLETAFDLNDDWDVTLTHVISRLAVGGGERSFVTRVEFGVDIGKAWHVDLGAERDQSSSFTDTLGLASVAVTL